MLQGTCRMPFPSAERGNRSCKPKRHAVTRPLALQRTAWSGGRPSANRASKGPSRSAHRRSTTRRWPLLAPGSTPTERLLAVKPCASGCGSESWSSWVLLGASIVNRSEAYRPPTSRKPRRQSTAVEVAGVEGGMLDGMLGSANRTPAHNYNCVVSSRVATVHSSFFIKVSRKLVQASPPIAASHLCRSPIPCSWAATSEDDE